MRRWTCKRSSRPGRISWEWWRETKLRKIHRLEMYLYNNSYIHLKFETARAKTGTARKQ
jgi:hypothetical protein